MASTPFISVPLPVLPGPPRELLDSTTFLLKRLGMAVKERTSDAFESTGVTGQHFGVLLVLAEGAPETQGSIADALGYDRSVLVGLLDELEERGLVERKRDPADRRRHLVRLTEAGSTAIESFRRITTQVEHEFLSSLTVDERNALHGLLLKLMSQHDLRCAASIGRG